MQQVRVRGTVLTKQGWACRGATCHADTGATAAAHLACRPPIPPLPSPPACLGVQHHQLLMQPAALQAAQDCRRIVEGGCLQVSPQAQPHGIY